MISLEFPDPTSHIDPGVERNVIACIVKSQEAWLTASYTVDPQDFVVDINRALWVVVDSLYSKGAHVDPVVVFDLLSKEHKAELEDLGGWNYIQALQDLPINPNNVEFEVDKLLELSTRRRIENAGGQLKEISKEKKSIEEVQEDVETVFNSINKEEDEEIVNIADNGIQFLEKRLANVSEVPGLSTGFKSLDVVIQGLQSGRLYVIGAPQKTGKSMLLLNWARNIVVNEKQPILWISTEHSIDDEFSRLLSLESNVPEASINNGTFSKVDVYADRVDKAYHTIKGSPFYFLSMPLFTLDKIRRVTRYMARVHKIKALFFDFIKTNESGADKEWMQLGILAYGLKSLAMKEDIPVITACQVNREGKNNFKYNGDMDSNNFAGSDRISHAMSVGFVLRPPTEKENTNIEQFRVLSITDNRHGPSGRRFLLDFDGEVISMTENKVL